MRQPYAFPLSLQTVLPADYRHNDTFRQQMETLQHRGFSGVELNIADPFAVNLPDLQDFLGRFNLRMTQFASGLSAKMLNLSLSNASEVVRRESVAFCRECLSWLAGDGAGMIVGFLKGPAASDVDTARAQFARSLEEIGPLAGQLDVPVLIEATNRYESAVANGLADTAALVTSAGGETLRILPDTFHMNIEEADSETALEKYRYLFDSLHISDNNRFFPGHGAIDFHRLFRLLRKMGYTGGLAIEGNLKAELDQDLACTMEYLTPLLLNNTPGPRD